MTRKELIALRTSILSGVLNAIRDYTIGVEKGEVPDIWCDGEKEWKGPEVERQCRRAYTELTRTIGQMKASVKRGNPIQASLRI